ncbi:hypothetical protein LTR53_014779 [Teratosphaeriaceae sp. CCFEE 6253]|nr:hypothetical protein LTR53_014779 [Teratosphaeriaceae sp. CCFEE 6253]
MAAAGPVTLPITRSSKTALSPLVERKGNSIEAAPQLDMGVRAGNKNFTMWSELKVIVRSIADAVLMNTIGGAQAIPVRRAPNEKIAHAQTVCLKRQGQ